MPSLVYMNEREHIPPGGLTSVSPAVATRVQVCGRSSEDKQVSESGRREGAEGKPRVSVENRAGGSQGLQSGRGHHLSKLFCYINRLAEITTRHRRNQSPKEIHILSMVRPSSALLLQLGLTPIIHQTHQRPKSEYSTHPNRCHLDKHYEVGETALNWEGQMFLLVSAHAVLGRTRTQTWLPSIACFGGPRGRL